MLAIVLSACLIADPKHCRDFKIPLDVSMDAMQCTMAAPPYFAQWAEEHPKWQIRRWTCQSSSLNDT